MKKSILCKSLLLTSIALAASLQLFNPAQSQMIITDGKTSTNVVKNGAVTTITTTTIKYENAFNSFAKFDVDSENTVNMIVPAGAFALVNTINGPISHINGILNCYQNGQIGGNVVFANPNGMIIGASGVINTGGVLKITTPNQAFMNGFYNGIDDPDFNHVVSLFLSTFTFSPNSKFINNGNINTLGEVWIEANSVQNNKNILSVSNQNVPQSLRNIVNTDSVNGGISLYAVNDLTLGENSNISHNSSVIVDGVNVEIKKGTKLDAKTGQMKIAGDNVSITQANIKGNNILINAIDEESGGDFNITNSLITTYPESSGGIYIYGKKNINISGTTMSTDSDLRINAKENVNLSSSSLNSLNTALLSGLNQTAGGDLTINKSNINNKSFTTLFSTGNIALQNSNIKSDYIYAYAKKDLTARFSNLSSTTDIDLLADGKSSYILNTFSAGNDIYFEAEDISTLCNIIHAKDEIFFTADNLTLDPLTKNYAKGKIIINKL